jgi:tRNA U34 5-methylaminomethyl-2-thiouridine-forming methyltransferase MnmC
VTWGVVLTADGSYTLAHPRHGETCHSRAGAWQEARERFARECGVRERALEIAACDGGARERGVLRLLDIGTGLGLNIAAALEAVDGTGIALDVVTLEHDASVISSTLELEAIATRAPALEPFHALVRRALASACASAASDPAPVPLGAGCLRLFLADAREVLPRLRLDVAFDAVFLDPFSPRVEPELWQAAFLREIARRMAPAAILSTYSSALTVRAALVAAGLRVGPGARVGTKAAGTIASPAGLVGALDPRTVRRVGRRAEGMRSDLFPLRHSASGEPLI